MESPWSASATRSRTWSTGWPDSASRADQRPAAGDRLEAAGRAAPAGQLAGGVDGGVPDLAGGAEVAAEHPSAGDDAEPEAGGRLDDQDVVEAAAPPSSSERASTSASFPTNSGASARSAKYGASVDAVPAGHHRGADAQPAGAVEGAGQAEPDAEDRRVDALEQAARADRPRCGSSSSGPTPTSWSRESEAISWPSRSSTASWLRERPTATASTTPASWLKTRAPGGRPPVEASSSPRQQQPGRGQRGDPGGDGGAGQPGEQAQLASGCWPGRCAPGRAARRRSRAPRSRGSRRAGSRGESINLPTLILEKP